MSLTKPVGLAAIALIVVLAFVTNPSAEKHRAAIKAAVADRSPVAGALGVGVLAAFTSNYESWGVCSITRVNDRTVSIGAFGVVHVRSVMPPAK